MENQQRRKSRTRRAGLKVFYLIENIFGKLLELRSNKSSNKGEQNQSVVLKAEGDVKNVDISKDGVSNPTAVSSSSDREIINELKKEILTSSKLGIVEVVEKAKTVARLNNDNEEFKWLEKELMGYDENDKEVPDYRMVEAVMDLGIYSENGFSMDMRDEPVDISLGMDIVQLEKGLTKDASHLRITAGIHPALEDALENIDYEQIRNVGGTDKDKVEYLIEIEETEKLIRKLRQEVRDYIGGIPTPS